MKPKGTYKVFCPASLGNKSDQWSQNSAQKFDGDVTYEIEVIESSKQPLALQPGFQLEDMVDGQCFYVVHQGRNKNE